MAFKDELLGMLSELDEFTTDMILGCLSLHPKIPRSTYYTTLNRLQKQGLVKKKRRGKIFTVALTLAGKKLLDKHLKLEHRTDGLSTIIIFDVPEEHRRAREALRRYLLRNGYIALQESVMLSPNKIDQGLKELLVEFKIGNYVSILSGRIDHILWLYVFMRGRAEMNTIYNLKYFELLSRIKDFPNLL